MHDSTAIYRKVAMARSGDEIAVWGDGDQTHSFLYIDESIEGTVRLLRSNFVGPMSIVPRNDDNQSAGIYPKVGRRRASKAPDPPAIEKMGDSNATSRLNDPWDGHRRDVVGARCLPGEADAAKDAVRRNEQPTVLGHPARQADVDEPVVEVDRYQREPAAFSMDQQRRSSHYRRCAADAKPFWCSQAEDAADAVVLRTEVVDVVDPVDPPRSP
jgi:hypothetical protein